MSLGLTLLGVADLVRPKILPEAETQCPCDFGTAYVEADVIIHNSPYPPSLKKEVGIHIISLCNG